MYEHLCVVIFYVFFVFNNNCLASSNKCVLIDSCSCQINDNRKIDISEVLEHNEYLNDTRGNITYYFLGCKDKKISFGNLIVNASSLVKYDAGFNGTEDQKYTTIGHADSIKFEFSSTEHKYYMLVYNETRNPGSAYPSIHLNCDTFSKPFIHILNVDTNELILSSPKVCAFDEPKGLSGGSIFLILLVTSTAIYLIGGALILYFIRGATGIEMIPNIDFWKNLPGLIKDGGIFLFSGCRPNLISASETYDRI